jgi:hypothetical protein
MGVISEIVLEGIKAANHICAEGLEAMNDSALIHNFNFTILAAERVEVNLGARGKPAKKFFSHNNLLTFPKGKGKETHNRYIIKHFPEKVKPKNEKT